MSSDKNLTCVECNTSFVYSADDQQFHASKGYTEPKRCPSCRTARRNAGGSSYGSGGYSSGGGAGGGGGYGGGGGGGYGRDRGPREMFTATCSSCGKALIAGGLTAIRRASILPTPRTPSATWPAIPTRSMPSRD